ncbi:MAG: tripartite tricarboxylate transporter TctB family protein [Deltaproteobacteria bacterium]|nr:tripartite tricarboxylate transporter TctB family protein [Deltaproteobacteria bacterium]
MENRRLRLRFRPGSLLTFFFLAAFALAVTAGWQWPFIAKLMPVYSVAIPGALLALTQLYREVTAWKRAEGESTAYEADEVFDTRLDRQTEISRTLSFFGWFVGGAAATWLFGIVIALPLMMLLYTLIEGKEKWRVSFIMSIGIFLLIWGVFEYLLETRWPSGALFQ